MCDIHYFNYDPSLFDSRVEMTDMLLFGNTTGNVPLHFAASYATADVIEYIADMCQEALCLTNSSGDTAYDVAINKGRDESIIALLKDLSLKYSRTAVENEGPTSHMSSASNCSSVDDSSQFDDLGNPTKKSKKSKSSWKKHKRAGAKKAAKALAVKGVKEEEEDTEMFDDRIGDAEDRVKDVDHVIEHGIDVDETETAYVTAYTTVKKKKRWKLLGCFGVKKRKKKVIGY
jgi:hypothetical protein